MTETVLAMAFAPFMFLVDRRAKTLKLSIFPDPARYGHRERILKGRRRDLSDRKAGQGRGLRACHPGEPRRRDPHAAGIGLGTGAFAPPSWSAGGLPRHAERRRCALGSALGR